MLVQILGSMLLEPLTVPPQTLSDIHLLTQNLNVQHDLNLHRSLELHPMNSSILEQIWSCFKKNDLDFTTLTPPPGANRAAICDCQKPQVFESFLEAVRNEVGTENKIRFLNLFMGIYDRF